MFDDIYFNILNRTRLFFQPKVKNVKFNIQTFICKNEKKVNNVNRETTTTDSLLLNSCKQCSME